MARPVSGRRRLLPACESLEVRQVLSTATTSTSPTDLLIGLRPGLRPAVVQSLLGGLQPQQFESLAPGQVQVTLAAGLDVDAAVARLQRSPLVRYVEPDGTIKVQAVQPNDTRYSQQWALASNGLGAINAPAAWQITTGNPATIVAVIDSGIDTSHPDLAGRLWVNTAEANGRPGVDDDRDGYVDDINGWNFRDRNANLSDGARHGTHVAGIIAAASNNSVGVAGVNWQAKIMPLKFIGADGNGSISDAVKAIYFAVQKGAKVINASWSGFDTSAALSDAIRYAGTKGIVFVSAAGNESANNDVIASYPARYRFENTLTVAASSAGGSLASFSNYGPTTVDIAAPGENILSTQAGRTYESLSGTSMAAPFVTGVVSLLAGKNPTWSASQLVQRVLATARRTPGLQGRLVSGGIVDAAAALGASAGVSSAPSAPASTPAPSGLSSGDLVRRDLLATDEYFRVRGGGTLGGFLDALYRDVVGRPINASESSLWLEQLAWQDRSAIVGQILAAPEARVTKLARWLIGDLGWPASDLASIKANPTIVGWADPLASGTADAQVRAQILATPEFYQRSGGTDAGWAAALYDRALCRAIDPGALSNIQTQLAWGVSRQTIAQSVLNSAEARAARVGVWFLTDLQRTQSITALKADRGVIALASRITS